MKEKYNKNLRLPREAITPMEGQQIYGTPVGTLANWRYHGTGPRYYKVSRKVYYLVRDFEEWFYRNPVLTSDYLSEAGK